MKRLSTCSAAIWPPGVARSVLYIGLLLFLAASCIAPPYPDYLLLQHVPTPLVVLPLPYLANRYRLSLCSFTLIVVFLALHTLGARYLYSFVPYDDWCFHVAGIRLSDEFGFERNHYDRLVHFSYGLFLVLPLYEARRQIYGLPHGSAALFALEWIAATAGFYEIVEWLVAVFLAPDMAESFNGQQGDPFDAQKDMALAMLGAVITIAVLTLTDRARAARGRAHSAQDGTASFSAIR